MSKRVHIREIIKDILVEYKKSDLYLRNLALDLGHDYILLNNSFNYYNIGVRALDRKNDRLLVDVSFFFNIDYYCDDFDDIFNYEYSLVVISNDFNLRGITIKYKNIPIYFMLDMSLHFLSCSRDVFGDILFNISLFNNLISSGINCELDDYYIHQFINNNSDIQDINEVVSVFDSLFLNLGSSVGYSGMYLSKSDGYINVHFTLDLGTVNNKHFIAELIKYISSKNLSSYLRMGKSVSFYLDIIDDKSEYLNEDIKFINILSNYFDEFSYVFN